MTVAQVMRFVKKLMIPFIPLSYVFLKGAEYKDRLPESGVNLRNFIKWSFAVVFAVLSIVGLVYLAPTLYPIMKPLIAEDFIKLINVSSMFLIPTIACNFGYIFGKFVLQTASKLYSDFKVDLSRWFIDPYRFHPTNPQKYFAENKTQQIALKRLHDEEVRIKSDPGRCNGSYAPEQSRKLHVLDYARDRIKRKSVRDFFQEDLKQVYSDMHGYLHTIIKPPHNQ